MNISEGRQTLPEGESGAPERSEMIRSFIRLLTLIGLGSFMILAALPLGARLKATGVEVSLVVRLKAMGWSVTSFGIESALLIVAALIATMGLYVLLMKLEPWLDSNALAQAHFLANLDLKYVDASIVFSAALSLFLELAMIRWQSSVLEFLAFYKNFTLIACFAGLGIGYSLAARKRIALVLVIPLLGWQFFFMMMIRFVPGLFHIIPFREELTMGFGPADWPRAVILYVLLSVIFLLTAVTFLPVGQLCGQLMERREKLRSYGLNLAGSIVGVVVMLIASFLWTPPLFWFALCFLVMLLFHLRTSRSLVIGIVASTVCTIILAWWPVSPLLNRVYSPYQLLEIGPSEQNGLTTIRAAGHYYQRIYDLSASVLSGDQAKTRNYYDFAYKAHSPLTDVAVVGAGSGNDVAAALRAGAGRVDAIEIDPAIIQVGQLGHPEKPYSNPRTTVINNDARSFLRGTDRKYDLIVYGLLDSHTLLSSGSSVRLDSFVYTIEGLKEARSRLKPGGAISLSFTVLSDALGHKIYLMMQEAFDGRPPICVQAGYDGGVIFMESNDANWTLPAALRSGTGLIDQSALYGNPALKVDVSTDDWPFFYMPRRIYPVSYLIVIFQIIVLSWLLARNFLGEKPKFSQAAFFFLGLGFMLVETKGITEMGLTFGNTWLVIGVVITGIMIMAFLGNWLVQRLAIRNPLAPYILLLATLGLGWFISKSGGFSSTPFGRLETAIVLTCPLLFSGIVFSTLLTTKGQVSGMMAMNLLGAICGGLLEYNSMYFGFRSLYLVAMVCYILAFASGLVTRSRGSAAIAV